MRILPKTISEKEFLQIIDGTRDKKLKLAFMLGFYQCLRVAEIINLKPENVDLERNMLHIKWGKGKKDRDIPIMPPVKSGLKHLPISGRGYSKRSLQRKFGEYSDKIIGKKLNIHLLRHCLSQDTEILTVNGWKRYNQLEKGMIIPTLNLTNNHIEFQDIKEINVYDFEGEMFRIKNLWLNYLCTNEHNAVLNLSKIRRIPNTKKDKDIFAGWELITFKDLLKEKGLRQIHHRLSGKSEGKISIGKSKAGILGWILSDGRITPRKRSKGFCISISQNLTSNPKKCEYIRNLLIDAKIPYTESIYKNRGSFLKKGEENEIMEFLILKGGNRGKIKGGLHNWIFDWINFDRTPKWKLLMLKKEELEELYKCMMLGDGTRGNEYCGQNKNRIDFFRALCHLIGYRTNLSYKNQNGKNYFRTYISRKDYCNLYPNLLKRRINGEIKNQITKERYKGKVWCPTVFNGTWIARANEKIFITGNSGASFYLNDKGVDIRHVQLLLGHSFISTTMIYTHVTPKGLSDIYKKAWGED